MQVGRLLRFERRERRKTSTGGYFKIHKCPKCKRRIRWEPSECWDCGKRKLKNVA